MSHFIALIQLLWEYWKNLWGILGIVFLGAIGLYFTSPDKIEKIGIHIKWLLGFVSSSFERKAIASEVQHIVLRGFQELYPIQEILKIKVEFGDEDKTKIDLERNELVIVLRKGTKYRQENIARTLLKAIPDLLAPEMRAVYDPKFLDCLSAHIAKNLAKDYLPVITSINAFITAEMNEDKEYRELSQMLVEIDDESLLSRILLPELIDVAKIRYPHRDPQIDNEVLELIQKLQSVVRGEISEPMVCGKYFKMVIVRVAKPEKIEMLLQPHINYVKHVINECKRLENIYILAAGQRNISLAKAFKESLKNELEKTGIKIKTFTEHEYIATYRQTPAMKLYTCRVKIQTPSTNT
jgi:hypothetical protein